jgi:hypothetical protein
MVSFKVRVSKYEFSRRYNSVQYIIFDTLKWENEIQNIILYYVTHNFEKTGLPKLDNLKILWTTQSSLKRKNNNNCK